MKPQASLWEPAERHVLAQAVRSVATRPPTAHIEDEYGLSEDVFHMALVDLRVSTSQVDVFRRAALRKCPRVWTKEDNRLKRGWSSNLWDLLCIHAPRG